MSLQSRLGAARLDSRVGAAAFTGKQGSWVGSE